MKFLFAAASAAAVFLFAPNNLSAQSNDAILQRLAALEKENVSLHERIRRLETKSATAARVPHPSNTPTADFAMVARPSGEAVAEWRRAMPTNWSGIHVGVFSSYALGRWAGTAPDYPHQPVNGWLGGVAIGYDHQFSPNWLVGIEADAQVADVKATDNYIDAAETLRLDYLATVRGRVGYVWDRSLLYLTGGLAAGHLKTTVNQYHPGGLGSPPFQTSAESVHYGYAVGGGWQWALFDNAALKLEYLWIDLPEQDYVFPRAPGFTGDNTARVGWNGHTAKVGIDWSFH